MNYVEYPLKDIPEPHVHDVLCGRGGGTNNHIGNSHWRMLVAANKQLYITLPKRQKMLLSRSIVNAVRSQNPPGRFLQKDGKTKLWFDVGDQRAQEKTSQALREGAPDIRKKVLAANNRAGGNTNNSEASTTTPAAPTSGDISKSGVKREGGDTAQIPAHSSTASSVTPQQQQPESASSSAILPQTTGTVGGIIPPPESGHYNPHQQQQQQQHQQQQHQQQQQMNNMYAGNSALGHMNLNERGVMIQNAMLNGARGLNSQHPLPMYNNQMDYQSSNSAYRFQQQRQQDNLQQQMHPQQDYHQQYQYHQQQQNVNYQQQHQQQQHQQHHHHHQQQQQQQYHENKNNTMSTFDDYDTAPPEQLESEGLSFGSLHMTDAEMNRLQEGSAHGKSKYQTKRWHSNLKTSPNEKASSNNINNDTNNNNGSTAVPTPPMGGVLEPTGISIGDVSMHSVGTNYLMKLEDNGASFGTVMSYNTMSSSNPDMVDGGLMDAVGTSFGSLSLDKNNRDMLFKTLEVAGGGPEVPPMFRSETKSSTNLLDCSDTESESSREKEQLTKQKSQAWEMMKTQLEKQTSRGASVDSHDLMPPPVGVPQNSNNTNSDNDHKNASGAATFDNLEIALPPTTMEANFSTLSAWSAGDDGTDYNDDGSNDVAVPPPPPQLTKTDSF